MAEYDLVVRGGRIVDGTGAPAVRGDVAVAAGRIVAVGRVPGRGTEEIDADGAVVTPGFVDIHTHYDGQATWEERMTPSSQHGVTTVVTGNCGVGFAPCRPDQHDLLVELMEGVEDIPEVVMTAGLPWTWETFPEFLDVLASRRLDVDLAAQVPHSAVRVYVMGERGAAREVPTDGDLAAMRGLVAEAVRAGALGVTTSRSIHHRTRAGEQAPSIGSEERELLALAAGLRDAGTGVFQLMPSVESPAEVEVALMRRLAAASGRPLSFSLFQINGEPDKWRTYLDLLEEAAADGLPIRGQVFPRPIGFLFGLDLSIHPFALSPGFRPLLDLPLAEKVAAMRQPEVRARLLAEEPADPNPFLLHMAGRYVEAHVMGDPPDYEPDPEQTIGRRAARLGVRPLEYVYDLLLADEGRTVLFCPSGNYARGTLDDARTMAEHPATVLGLGDGGAHYGLVCDSSYPTSLLQDWVQQPRGERRMDLSRAVAELSDVPARAVGLADRGRLAPGYRADLNVIDLERLHLHRPSVVHDLPAGGRRLRQQADGYVVTVAGGAVTRRDGEPTGELPGRLVRGAQPAPA
ncbi:amidohydrolase family protein [Blastococcus sp. URHD0036]|uniref:N-acyl-D-amino-acid deacylase family protein n=1 Tax=Blastococcus sp. URHD0036 TaxID=1380356 RepID=UPI0004953FE5|nr:amidohydrolase family protein [Blastococcus sp. URHD0036]